MKDFKFKIVIIGGPAENYILRCLQSVDMQLCHRWQAAVVLDPVGDKAIEQAAVYLNEKLSYGNRAWFFKKNEKRMYALTNIINAIELLKCTPEDVIVTLDADDWLYSKYTLSLVEKEYRNNPDLCLTHGSWVSYPDPNANTNNAPYTLEEFRGNIRKCPWHGSHLRTFKYKLWKNIKDRDLRDRDGQYYMSAWDTGFMWPMMEMAGYHRIKYIPEKLYVYNQETPYNDAKVRGKQQMDYTDYIAAQKPYPYIEDL